MNPTLLGSPVYVGHSREDVLCQAADAVSLHLAASGPSGLDDDGTTLVISGGATTPLILQHVAAHWQKNWLPTLLLSDERHTQMADERNDEALRHLLRETPFAHARIVSPPANVDIVTAANIWAESIASLRPAAVALVSMADDGHVAGLFASCHYESVGDAVVVTRESPKPPLQRISLSNSFLRTIP
ncbi:MAG: 6-phosphogluconolactonase, partial [Actinomycetota bacterium]